MNRKDILELKKRFKKDESTFTKLCGCFVNTEKDILLDFEESFYNLDEDDFFKYLDIAKKVLSGTVGNNLLDLHFSANNGEVSDKQDFLIEFKKSKLKDKELIDDFYQSIINNYNYEGNYLILIFHDIYDIIAKTSDNFKLDVSEEVYEYVLCALCPVSLSKPGLSYYEEENAIKSRLRDWIVEPPVNGFVYPAFTERSPDVNSLIYYTKNTKVVDNEFIENTLGCQAKDTYTIQKGVFEAIVKGSVSADEEEADIIYMQVQDKLNTVVEDHKLNFADRDDPPMVLSKADLQDILLESGVGEDKLAMIQETYQENFNKSLPSAEGLIDKKVLKAGEQAKKEIALQNQVDFLKDRLEKLDPTTHEGYDIVVQVKSHKLDKIRSQVIDGQEYMLIPLDEGEKTTINKL